MSRCRRWPMATHRCVGIAALVLMAFGVPFVSQAIAQEAARQGELSRTLEAANLSPEGKALLRAKGIEVVRAGEALCRSEEHTSELQSRPHLVCRLLLEKKNC